VCIRTYGAVLEVWAIDEGHVKLCGDRKEGKGKKIKKKEKRI
jgi:hypothetical protein